MNVNISPKLHPKLTIPTCIFFSFTFCTQPFGSIKKWQMSGMLFTNEDQFCKHVQTKGQIGQVEMLSSSTSPYFRDQVPTHSFPKIGRLEVFRKFIEFGPGNAPLRDQVPMLRTSFQRTEAVTKVLFYWRFYPIVSKIPRWMQTKSQSQAKKNLGGVWNLV